MWRVCFDGLEIFGEDWRSDSVGLIVSYYNQQVSIYARTHHQPLSPPAHSSHICMGTKLPPLQITLDLSCHHARALRVRICSQWSHREIDTLLHHVIKQGYLLNQRQERV